MNDMRTCKEVAPRNGVKVCFLCEDERVLFRQAKREKMKGVMYGMGEGGGTGC